MGRKKAVVDQERYGVLKGMLEERRLEIQQKLRSLRETLPVEAGEVRDAEEQSVDDFVQEVDFALMQMKSQTLAKIDEAIVGKALYDKRFTFSEAAKAAGQA